MNKLTDRSAKGFTLVELMVTLAVASILVAGIYKVYQTPLLSKIVSS